MKPSKDGMEQGYFVNPGTCIKLRRAETKTLLPKFSIILTKLPDSGNNIFPEWSWACKGLALFTEKKKQPPRDSQSLLPTRWRGSGVGAEVTKTGRAPLWWHETSRPCTSLQAAKGMAWGLLAPREHERAVSGRAGGVPAALQINPSAKHHCLQEGCSTLTDTAGTQRKGKSLLLFCLKKGVVNNRGTLHSLCINDWGHFSHSTVISSPPTLSSWQVFCFRFVVL